VFVVSVYALRHGVYALAGETYEHPPWPYLFFYEGVKLLLFAGLWLGIIFGLASFASWRHERERLLTLQKQLAESQLAQLRAQLQPHFLFNALNTISSLMQVDVERADRLLTMLADLLRASLSAGSRQMSSLREEMDLLGLYARIMQERFPGRVTLRWDVAEDALDAAVPAMLLQPLLENAYKHGVERSTSPVAVAISAQRQGDVLRVTLGNSGELQANTPGIGLRNCRERLAVLYGDSASLTLTSGNGEVTSRLTLPYRRHAP
jgi:LytS/YehU family sensor histidine kinase